MKRIKCALLKLDEWQQVTLFGNLVELILFGGLSFGFFTNMIDLPLGVLLAWPFAALNFYLYARQMSGALEQGFNRKKVVADYVLRYLVLLVPLAISLTLWILDLPIFNPIVIAVSFILFRLGLFVVRGQER